MKLVFILAVSLIAVFMVDCRSHPGPDSQLPNIAEEHKRQQTQGPFITAEPELSEEHERQKTQGPFITAEPELSKEHERQQTQGPFITTESEHLAETTITDGTPEEPPFTIGFDTEEEKELSESELRESDVLQRQHQTQDLTITLEAEHSKETTPITDGPNGPTFTLGSDIEEENGLSNSELKDVSDVNGLSESELRGSSCKPKSTCTILGGHCITNATNCMGKLVPNSCKGSNCECCVPGCPEGYIKFSSSNQCFKFFNDALRNWTEAYNKCQSHKLMLAKPFNSRELRSYLTERYGGITDGNAWVGARGDGSYIRWLVDKERLSSGSPLWVNGHPTSKLSTSYCLLLLNRDYWWKVQPNQTYYSRTCYSRHYTLCELPME